MMPPGCTTCSLVVAESVEVAVSSASALNSIRKGLVWAVSTERSMDQKLNVKGVILSYCTLRHQHLWLLWWLSSTFFHKTCLYQMEQFPQLQAETGVTMIKQF